ncbi:DUF6787 family protein [Mangrovimonas aestuarii]|uniref:DUF6787 family protein n=1 Tax=Mangrovimonas aestuarii TaxID=3018443 RepID=UPI002378D95A|nr:DUF6787 family protein [Mangrovimonas aestuarii]
MEKLKARWGISSNKQLIIIFTVFAVTGSSSVFVTTPLLEVLGITKDNLSDYTLGKLLYYILKTITIFPVYQVLLVSFGWIFGQFSFFWAFEKKMLSRIGLKRFVE